MAGCAAVRYIPHMEVTTARRSERPAGLDASTVAEAFQLTAAAHPDRVALRLKDDELSLTWAEYADKVRRVAAGLELIDAGGGPVVPLPLLLPLARVHVPVPRSKDCRANRRA